MSCWTDPNSLLLNHLLVKRNCSLGLFGREHDCDRRSSGRILNWLSSSAMAQARIIHCGDYDPVGLDEYLRLKTACPERAGLYLPADLDDLFSRYGKGEILLGSNGAILARLRKIEDQEVRRIVELMDRHGVGLEQEVLLLSYVR